MVRILLNLHMTDKICQNSNWKIYDYFCLILGMDDEVYKIIDILNKKWYSVYEKMYKEIEK